jgi:hypothetical protein
MEDKDFMIKAALDLPVAIQKCLDLEELEKINNNIIKYKIQLESDNDNKANSAYRILVKLHKDKKELELKLNTK